MATINGTAIHGIGTYQLENRALPEAPQDGESFRLPFFSVVMNAYNSARTLPRAIESVLRQEVQDFELVVVDDGSTDETQDVLARYRDDSRVRIYRQKNAKCAAARQAGIVAARGEHVVFLDSDDEAVPGWLTAFQERLRQSDADIVSAGVRILLPRRRSRSRMPSDNGPILNHLTGLFLSGSFSVRRAILLAVGGYVAGTEPVDHTDFRHRLVRYMERTPVSFATIMREVVIIHREETVPYRAQAMLKGSLHLLRSYPEHFQRDPRVKSRYLCIAGVSAARMGDYTQARSCFRAACLETPLNLKCRLRSWIGGIPALAALLWKRSESNGRAKE